MAARSEFKPILLLTGLGVALRVLLLVLSGSPEYLADEGRYLYSALQWNFFGYYSDEFRYMWPPGYPLLLAEALELFGIRGVLAIKLLQAIAASSIGIFTMLIGRELFGIRVAKVAGAIWAVYLPLAGYAHLLWTESLYLSLFTPALYFLLRVHLRTATRPDRALLLAGILLAGSAYFREVSIHFAAVCILFLLWRREATTFKERLRQASLLGLTFVVCVLPWTLRNASLYDRLVPIGETLGENCFQGLNADYINFDLIGLEEARRARGVPQFGEFARGTFEPAAGEDRWPRALTIRNTIDRSREQARRGVRWARRQPGDFFRTRVRKVADLVTPHSFSLRHLATGLYDDSALGATWIRRPLTAWLLLAPLLLLPLGLAGLTRLPRGAGPLFYPICAILLASTMVVSMSRVRVPMLPLLFVLAASMLVDRIGKRRLLVITVALAGLWWITLPEMTEMAKMAWEAAP